MALINFTVNFDALTVQTDDSDAGADFDTIALVGTVTFTPVLADDRPALAPAYSPRPAGIKLRPITGYVDSDGQLKSARSGTVGVRLPARDPVLNLSSLYYRADFNLTTPLGEKVPVEGGWFAAPTTDTPVQLANVLQQTGSGAVGVTAGPPGPAGAVGAIDGGIPSSTGPIVLDGGNP